MDPITGAILGSSFLGSAAEGGLGFIGNMMQGKQAQQNAQNQFFYNLLLQGQQQQYNSAMANTQYQRSVADMKAAGINPMSLYGHAGLDSAPTSGMSSVSQADAVNPTEGVAQSAHQGAKLGQEIDQLDKSIKKLTSETDLANKLATKAQNETIDPGQAQRESSGRASASEGSAAASQETARNLGAQRRGEMGDVGVLGSHAPIQTVRGNAARASSSLPGLEWDKPLKGLDFLPPSWQNMSIPSSAKDLGGKSFEFAKEIRRAVEAYWAARKTPPAVKGGWTQ